MAEHTHLRDRPEASRQGKQGFAPIALALCCGLLLCSVPAQAADQPGGAEQAAPQDPNSTNQDTRPGETLGDRMARTEGTIKPPEDVDPGIAGQAPDPDPGTTPVIPPPGSSGGNENVQPR
jgi:hypothetical protein